MMGFSCDIHFVAPKEMKEKVVVLYYNLKL